MPNCRAVDVMARAMLSRLGRLREFLVSGLWEEIQTQGRLRRAGLAVVRVGNLAVRGFLADRCLLHATALAYATMLSLVPLLAFAFAVAKGFGIQEQIKPVVENWLVANQKQVGEEIVKFINNTLEYVRATRMSIFGAIALLLLVWTVIKVLGTIERSFNQIWGVQRSRTLVRKFTDYISVLVVSPMLLLAGMSATAALKGSELARATLAALSLGSLIEFVLTYVTTWVALMAAYLFMPNTRVRLRAGLAGGVVAGSLWQLAFWLYTTVQFGVARYNAIYGTFAALPIFMIWLYLSWVIVLFGAEVAWATQNLGRWWEEQRSAGVSFAAKEELAVRLMTALAARFHRNGQALSLEELSERIKAPARLIAEVLAPLVEAGLCVEVVSRDSARYQPGRALDTITPADVVAAMRNRGEGLRLEEESPEGQVASRLWRSATEAESRALAGANFREIAMRVNTQQSTDAT